MREAAQAMLNGETGYRYVNLDGEDYYVFFKPFERSAVVGRALTNLGWSVGVILPEEDIFGDYWRLHYIVLIIAAVGLLLLLLSCRLFIRRQLIPLRQLEKSARHITEGRYDERIPDSRRLDEVGRLHSHFQQMQQSLATRVGEMQQLSDILKERGRCCGPPTNKHGSLTV
jgi:HAMP domain-containing protein